MTVSRRSFLKVTGAAAVAVAIDIGGLASRPPRAFAADAPTAVLNTPGRGLFSGVTTLDQTVVEVPLADPTGYHKLQLGPGESHVVRRDLWHYRQPTLALGAFVQITDMQIVDDQSSARVEFTDRWADPPAPFNPDTDAAYRPQEFLSTHIVESMARAIRGVRRGPMTGLPFSFTIATGDMVDNMQYNETRWYIDLLDGGHPIQADSGHIGFDESVSYRFAFDSLTPDAVFHESLYWSPEGLTDNFGRVDHYRLWHGFPVVLGLLSAARRPYTSTGLGMPWYAAMGNHDGEIQGNYPLHPTFIEKRLGLTDISGQATSGDKAYNSGVAFPRNPSPGDIGGFVDSLHYRPVTADPNRGFLSHSDFAGEHWNTTGMPCGHGFGSDDRTYYAMPSSDSDLIQYITLDTVCYDGGANGRVDIDQYHWLEAQLKANSARYIETDNTIITQPGVRNKLFVIFAHHTLDSTDNSAPNAIDIGGPDFVYGSHLEALLLRYPNVVLMVVGHTHRNVVIPHARGSYTSLGNRVLGDGGFWEVSTASHIDWPAQSRLLEIAAGDGVISIFTTMLDLASAPDPGGDLFSPTGLASVARELAYNDPTEKAKHNVADTDRHGDLDDRNTQLLVPAPFDIATPPQWGSALALGRNSDGRLEIFGTGTNDRTWQRSQITAGVDTWSDWAVFGGEFRTVAVEANLDGRLELFGINDGEVWHRWQLAVGGWSTWTSLGSIGARSITVARNSNGRLEVFVTTADGDVWHVRQTASNATSWLSWSTAFGGLGTSPATLFRKVAAETNTDGRVQVLAVTDGGWLWSRTQILTGGWTDWTEITADNPVLLTAVAMSRNADGRLQFYGVDSDRRVFESSQVSVGADAWSPWVALDDGRTRMTHVTARLNMSGLIEVFGVDNAGKPWHRRQTAANSRNYTAWTDFGGTLRPDVPAIPATILQPPRTVKLIQADTARYLDAHEIEEKDYQVVTRPLQTDDTQKWVLTDIGHGVYTIMQVSSGRFLNAYPLESADFRVVTRSAQTDTSQNWLLNDVGGGLFTIRQVSTGQFLDAYELSSQDFTAVTRPWKNADEQRWRIVNA